jgi:Fe2+ transport system protein B
MISSRQVSYETGEKLAESWKVPFLETSAKTKQNNAECFSQLVREIKNKEEQIRLTLHEANEEKSRCHCLLL